MAERWDAPTLRARWSEPGHVSQRRTMRSTGTSAGPPGLRGEGAADLPRGGDLVHGVGGVVSAAHLKEPGNPDGALAA